MPEPVEGTTLGASTSSATAYSRTVDCCPLSVDFSSKFKVQSSEFKVLNSKYIFLNGRLKTKQISLIVIE